MSGESISQLTRVCRQIHTRLPQLFEELLPDPLISAKLAVGQRCALSIATDNRPQQKVRDVLCDGLLEGRESSCVGSDQASVSISVHRKDVELDEVLL